MIVVGIWGDSFRKDFDKKLSEAKNERSDELDLPEFNCNKQHENILDIGEFSSVSSSSSIFYEYSITIIAFVHLHKMVDEFVISPFNGSVEFTYLIAGLIIVSWFFTTYILYKEKSDSNDFFVEKSPRKYLSEDNREQKRCFGFLYFFGKCWKRGDADIIFSNVVPIIVIIILNSLLFALHKLGNFQTLIDLVQTQL